MRGFLSISDKGQVFNEFGALYTWERPGIHFNLPELDGYFFDGEAASAPVRTYLPGPLPSRPTYKIKVGKPGQSGWAYAINIHGKKIVLLMPEVLEYPTHILTFILLHEEGHLSKRNASEEFCDLYAAKLMLQTGWNPSQVAAAAQTLSFIEPGRKAKILKFLKKWQIR